MINPREFRDLDTNQLEVIQKSFGLQATGVYDLPTREIIHSWLYKAVGWSTIGEMIPDNWTLIDNEG